MFSHLLCVLTHWYTLGNICITNWHPLYCSSILHRETIQKQSMTCGSMRQYFPIFSISSELNWYGINLECFSLWNKLRPTCTSWQLLSSSFFSSLSHWQWHFSFSFDLQYNHTHSAHNNYALQYHYQYYTDMGFNWKMFKLY